MLLVGRTCFQDFLYRPQPHYPKLCRPVSLSDRSSHHLAPLAVRGGRAATERKLKSLLVMLPETNPVPVSSLAVAQEIHAKSPVHKGTCTPVPLIQHHMEIFRTLRVALGVNSTLALLTVSQKASLGFGSIEASLVN